MNARPIAPQLTVNGEAVRLPIADRIAPLIDDLAFAYAEDPDAFGRLLSLHAVSVLALDVATVSDDATDYHRAMCAAEADATREALLEGLGAADQLDEVLTPDDAITLATRVTRLAARIRNTPKRTAR